MTNKFEPEGSEKDWLGPQNSAEPNHVIFRGQSKSSERRWFFSRDLITLDPDYSEFSVSLHDPRCKSLSFINRTLAILPKSKLRTIYNLIGAYLDNKDKEQA